MKLSRRTFQKTATAAVAVAVIAVPFAAVKNVLATRARRHPVWEFSAKDLTLSIEEFSEKYITPAMEAMAQSSMTSRAVELCPHNDWDVSSDQCRVCDISGFEIAFSQ